MGPLLYVTLCSFRNRIRVRVRRLKEPRYLVGAIVGAAYLWLVLLRPRSSSQPGGASGGSAGVMAAIGRGRALIESFGAVALFGMAALAWLWPGQGRPALTFTRAEVQFLFPAPFTRRQLIRYKIVRSQVGVLMGGALMTLLFRPATASEGWMFFGGVAILMTIINLHVTGVSLRRESLGRHGSAGLARQWLPVAIVAGACLVLVGTVALDWRPLASSATGPALLEEIQRLLSTGPVAIVLWPFRLVARLPLSETPADFLQALPGALLMLGLNYLWVVQSDASFEEASAQAAEKAVHGRNRAPRPARRANGVLSTPFTLALDGPLETAILWKNLILVGRYVSLKTLMRFLPILVIFGLAAGRSDSTGLAGVFGGACLIAFIMAVIVGPQLARNDLRQDLANMAVLKAWPIRGATLVRGEVMAPAAILIAIAWCSALGGLFFATPLNINPSFLVAAILLSPGVILMQLLFQNAIAVLWPSWVVVSTRRARGIDVMGQRMIMMFSLLLVLVLAVLPAALAGGLLMGGLYWLTGALWIVGPAVVTAIVLFVEVLVTSEMVGRVFDRTDVNAVDAAET